MNFAIAHIYKEKKTEESLTTVLEKDNLKYALLNSYASYASYGSYPSYRTNFAKWK